MKINYFKTKIWEDSYVAREDYMNIVCISKNDFWLMSDDENIFRGAYKNIEMNQEDFEKLKEFAEKKDRLKGINLLKKVHEENKNNLENNPLYAKHKDNFPKTCVPSKWAQYYNSSDPILE